ncbi:MAG: hypothetical protein RIC55_32440 [Pirellulaceae bacterium]
MKGSLGIIVAVFLGALALVLNWYYLYSKTRGIATVQFIGVNQPVAAGEVLREEFFEPVPVPNDQVTNNLRNYAYLYSDRSTVANIKATRDYEKNDLVLRSDYRTPQPELNLAENERVLLISVDSRNFVPALVDPGDLVTFVIPLSDGRSPTPASTADGSDVREDVLLEGNEMIGPFVVASLGSRLGSAQVMRANRGSSSQEKIVGIRVKAETDRLGRKLLEPSAMRLLELLEKSGGRNIQIVLHPRPER